MENYLYRGEDTEPICSHIKTICNPRKTEHFPDPHAPVYKPGFSNFSQRGSIITRPFFRDAHFDSLQINHYIIKSNDDYVARKKRGLADNITAISEERLSNLLKELDKCNAVYDPVLLPYAEKIKEQLASLP